MCFVVFSVFLNLYSVSNMFVSRGIPAFAELLRKSIYRFKTRIELSSNSIITACLSTLMYISSPVCNWWSSVLYMNESNNCMHVLVTLFQCLPLAIAYLTSLRSENHTPRFHLFNRSIRPYIL